MVPFAELGNVRIGLNKENKLAFKHVESEI